MASLRVTICQGDLEKGAVVEYFHDSQHHDLKEPAGTYRVSVSAVKEILDKLARPHMAEAGGQRAEAQMAHRLMQVPQIRLNRSAIMMMDKDVVRIATRFEAKEKTVLVAPGESNVKPMKVTLPSRWWICDYDKSGSLLYYALCTEINERTGEELERVQDPMVAQWSYGNSDPGGRICWGQSGVKVSNQSVGEIDDLFFGTPFNNHLFYRQWPKDGDIPKDLDNTKGQRLSAVLRGEAHIVQPQQRPTAPAQQEAGEATGQPNFDDEIARHRRANW